MRRRLGRAREFNQQDPAPGYALAAEQQGRIAVRPLRLIIVGALLLLVVLFAFDLQALLPQDWLAQWPTALTVVGVGLLLGGMVTANATATLVGPVVAALGLVSLLELPGGSDLTVISGAMVCAFGVGAVLRGLTQTRL